jgi:hypothetical protein
VDILTATPGVAAEHDRRCCTSLRVLPDVHASGFPRVPSGRLLVMSDPCRGLQRTIDLPRPRSARPGHRSRAIATHAQHFGHRARPWRPRAVTRRMATPRRRRRARVLLGHPLPPAAAAGIEKARWHRVPDDATWPISEWDSGRVFHVERAGTGGPACSKDGHVSGCEPRAPAGGGSWHVPRGTSQCRYVPAGFSMQQRGTLPRRESAVVGGCSTWNITSLTNAGRSGPTTTSHRSSHRPVAAGAMFHVERPAVTCACDNSRLHHPHRRADRRV